MYGVVFSDAVAFVNAVKSRFQDAEPERLRYFLDVLRNYDLNRGRMTMGDLFEGMKEVLKGHNDLIMEFSKFLPKGPEITLPLDDEQSPLKPVVFYDALNFENKILARDSELYKSFMEILGTYKGKNRSSAELYSEAVVLFKGHPDLLDELKMFFPKLRK